MKLNNKGFAISTIMYMVLVLAVLVMVLTLTILNGRKLILDKQKKIALENIYTLKTDYNFPIVFSLNGSCSFHGDDGNITGEACKKYKNSAYINTGVKLFNSENASKDFEIYLEISDYNPALQNGDVSIIDSMDRISSNTPGIIFKRDGNNLVLKSTNKMQMKDYTTSYQGVTKIRIVRRNRIIYYSINNGPITLLQDTSDFNQYFDDNVLIGGSIVNGIPDKLIKCTISNIKIRMGIMNDENFIGN